MRKTKKHKGQNKSCCNPCRPMSLSGEMEELHAPQINSEQFSLG